MRLLFYFWVLISLGSCVKEIGVADQAEYPNAYFINSFINSDSAAKVQLGKVSGVSEAYHFISDAELTFIVKGIRFPLTYVEMGWYQNNMIKMDPNDTLTLEIKHQDQIINKSIKIPSRVSVISVASFPLIVDFSGRTTGFRLRFKDSAYIENYYRLWVEENYIKYLVNPLGKITDSVSLVRRIPIKGNELSFIRNPYNTYTTREILFSDETFNGLNKALEFHRSVPGRLDERTLQYRVVLENLNRELFDFYNLRNAHIWQQSSITQTPTTVRGNIQGVYGILGGYQSAEYVLVP